MSEARRTRAIPRLLPDEPLPPYAFVPGRLPHPESDPAGHSFGRKRTRALPLDPAEWQASHEYLRGLDLFNHGFFWESHVEFESLWIAAGRKGICADFLKGLIHLAATGVKHLEGSPRGVKSHAARATELWRALASSGHEEFAGFKIAALIELGLKITNQGWPETATALIPSRH